MAKRVELPKANAFFGAPPPGAPVTDPKPSELPSPDPVTPPEEAKAPALGAGEKEVGGNSPQSGPGKHADEDVRDNIAASVGKDSEDEVEKVTLYLPPDIIRQLEVARVDLLLRHGTKVNRSRIAAAILRQNLEDISQHTPVGDRLVEVLTRT